MDETAFRAEQARRGRTEFHLRDWAPGTVNDTHTHDFAAAVLVLAGEITVETEAGTTTCRAGDTFALDAGVPHTERVGPDGVRFLSARP
jgi:quercetin dioxygenase-like cupin family protein